MHMHGLRHYLQQRKNRTEARDRQQMARRWIDGIMYFVGIVAPIMTLPQIIKIFHEQTAAGVSVLSWGAYALGSFFWFTYGVIHKEKPIIFTNCVAFVLQLFVVLGALMYR